MTVSTPLATGMEEGCCCFSFLFQLSAPGDLCSISVVCLFLRHVDLRHGSGQRGLC